MTNFKTMNKAELKAAADERGVEVDDDATNKEIVEALENAESAQGSDVPDESANLAQDNVEAPDASAPVVAGDEAPVSDAEESETKASDDDKVVVKFTANNTSYSVGSLKFTKSHPFHTVSEDLCDYLVSTGNFQEASADEVAEYYK